MPKDKYGDRDRYASDALRNVLPKHWKLKSPRDSDSGTEVCQDWVVEILDNNHNWTGAEFSIQNKTTLKVYAEYVSIPLAVDCVSYLLDQVTRPVLIHGYDIDNDQSYWIWLSEWKRLAQRRKWQNQNEVSIEIPKTNLLTRDSINEIQVRVLEEHFKASIRQQYDLANKINPDFIVTPPVFKGKNVYSVAHPKHSNASFRIEMDEENQKVFDKSMKYGEVSSIRIKSTDFPLPMLQDEHEIELKVFPYADDYEPPINVEYLDLSRNTIFESFFQLQNLRNGAVYKKWLSKPIIHPVFFELIMDIENETTNCNLQFDLNNRKPKDVKWYWDLYSQIAEVKYVRITNLETQAVTEFENSQKLPKMQYPDVVYKFVSDLAIINEKLEMNFTIPDEILDLEITKADLIAEILTTGQTNRIKFLPNLKPNNPNEMKIVYGNMPVHEIEKAMEQINNIGQLYLGVGQTNLNIELLNLKVDLGLGNSLVYCTRIINIDHLQQQLEYASVDELLKIEFAIEETKNLVTYPKWGTPNHDAVK